MLMRHGWILIGIGLVCCTADPVRAALRDPTPEEKQALDKAIAAIGKIFDPIENEDWEKAQDFYDGNPLVNSNPDVPLNINQNFQRDYHVRAGSPRERDLIQPLEKQMEGAGSPEAMAAVGRKIRPLMTLTVYAYLDMRAVDVKQAPGAAPKVAGAAFVYVVDPNEAFCQPGASCYLVGFGNWQTARRKPGEQALGFVFTHKPGTPFVENVVIRLTGADDRVRELLQTLDWNALNDALTR